MPLHGQSAVTFSTAVSLSQKSPQKIRQKRRGKIDKNGTSLESNKGHTFFSVPSNIKTKAKKNRTKKSLAWAKPRHLQHCR